MKIVYCLIFLAAVSLTACSTTKPTQRGIATPAAKTGPETVMVTYRVKPGNEVELQALLFRAWQTYRKERLVHEEPHILVRHTEDGGKVQFVEIFTWVSHEVMENPPGSVKSTWLQEHAFCEARDGHNDIEGVEVEIVTGKKTRHGWP